MLLFLRRATDQLDQPQRWLPERKRRSETFRGRDLLELHRLKIRRQDDLEHLAVVRIIEHQVLDARRLYPAASRLQ